MYGEIKKNGVLSIDSVGTATKPARNVTFSVRAAELDAGS